MGGNKKKGKSAPQATAVGVSADAISIVTTVAGDGASIPMDGDEVTVHYVGSLVSDGSMFDSSRKKKMPFVFKLGSGAVIKGWDMGVAQMSLGQRVKLKISSPAAYGAAGCTDKVNASGTGVIPPNADLLFDVELLDINHKKSVAALAKYRQTLDGWVKGKLEKFDASEETRAAMEAKHAGGREGYATYLAGVIATKYEAEREKRTAPAPAGTAANADANAANADADAADANAAATEGVAAVSIADHVAAPKQPAAQAAALAASATSEAAASAAAAPAPLQFDARFATFKVEPNDEAEGKNPNFPRNLHNAAELFAALGYTDAAAKLHACVSRNLATLEAGPDGKSAQRLGRACVCWSCGHVGLPSNAARCSEKGAKPAGVCGGCGEDAQTNFLRVVAADGKALPWIEHAPLTAAQEEKAGEARAAAAAAEVS